jgi:hypothetical protein
MLLVSSDGYNFGTKPALLICHAYYFLLIYFFKDGNLLVHMTKSETEVCLSANCDCLLRSKPLNIWMPYWLIVGRVAQSV